MTDVPAHDMSIVHHYVVHYPDHEPRASDPHYLDFETYRQAHVANARCAFAVSASLAGDLPAQRQDSAPNRLIGPGEHRAGCDVTYPLELHHSHVEFALQNAVDLVLLEKDYPGISNPNQIGAWVESGANLIFYCRWHHRGTGGAHSAAASDFAAERYVLGLIETGDMP